MCSHDRCSESPNPTRYPLSRTKAAISAAGKNSSAGYEIIPRTTRRHHGPSNRTKTAITVHANPAQNAKRGGPALVPAQ
jgi:hypothetical protein